MTHEPLWRRLLAELLGSGLLAAVVIGSGIAAHNLSPQDMGLQLLENAAATAAGLYVLIVVFSPVSGAHFNPIVTGADLILHRTRAQVAAAYVLAQLAGCCLGAVLANAMFSRPAVELSRDHRMTGAHWLAEVVATAGLLLVIFGLSRTETRHLSPAAVASYIGAAYFFTSSTSFANPAITVGRMLSNTFAGIAPSSAPGYIAAQIVGGGVGLGLLVLLFPHLTGKPMPDRPTVLFMCVHNAGRSQMAAAILAHGAGDAIDVRSAGSDPANALNPAVLAVMAEIGIDLSAEKPRGLTAQDLDVSDIVITMGCGDSCPVFPGKTYLDWALEDPAGLSVDQVRTIRDDIVERVARLVETLLPDWQGRGDPRATRRA